jgi:ribose transport system substrate-binding protein
MKKILSLVIVLTLALSCMAAFAEGDTMYISVISKGFQHQFWQTVAKGAQAAADEYGVEILFDGPASETEIDAQVEMLKAEMAKEPDAICLAALSTDAVMTELQECLDKGIPVIGFDSGVPNAPEGAIYATASTNNQNAAALAADEFAKLDGFTDMLASGTADAPVVIAVLSQDATSESVTGRTTGFVNEMAKIAAEYNTVSVEGHDLWAAPVEGAGVVIYVQISATTENADVVNAASAVLNLEGLKAVFISNEGEVNGFLSATADGSELAEGGRYAGLIVAGFDAGATQKNAVKNGWLVGSVTQDPYQIGYKAVELAIKAANGEEVADVDTGAQWYTAENMDDENIAMLLYD